MTIPTWSGVEIDPALLADHGYLEIITVNGQPYQRFIGYMAAGIAAIATLVTLAQGYATTTSATVQAAIDARYGVDRWTASGSPRTVPAGVYWELLDFGGTAATFSLTLPVAPVSGLEITITSVYAITTLTLGAGAGQTFKVAAPTTMTAMQSIVYRFYSNVWYRIS